VERTVLVTGAGSGIGLASAVEAARLGFRAVAAVHDPDQIDGVHAAAAAGGVAGSVEATVLDVTAVTLSAREGHEVRLSPAA
jgi:NAD(P)-dependent dehydrogenase (short-subunit alcohol dehydrogenase family)